MWRETTEATLDIAVFIRPQDASTARLLILQAHFLWFLASVTPDKITTAENVHSSVVSPQAGSKVLQKDVFLAAASSTPLLQLSLHAAANGEVGLQLRTVTDLLQQGRSESKRASGRDEWKYPWKKWSLPQCSLPARKWSHRLVLLTGLDCLNVCSLMMQRVTF